MSVNSNILCLIRINHETPEIMPQWKSKIRNLSAAVQLIVTKFCMNMQIGYKLRGSLKCAYFKNQDCGLPLYWKSIICSISTTIQLIPMKFCTNMPVATIRENLHLHILDIHIHGWSPYWKCIIDQKTPNMNIKNFTVYNAM